MSTVQIDDLECPYCDNTTTGELNIKTGQYTCFKCGKIINMEDCD